MDHSRQHSLLGDAPESTEPEGEQEEIRYTRGKAGKSRPDDCVTDSGLTGPGAERPAGQPV